MNPHLSVDEISQWLVGDRTAEDERHVGACAVCSSEIARLQTAVHDFGSAVREWEAPPAPVIMARRQVPRTARWVLTAAAALALTVAFPIYRQRQAAETARADAILLEQVDAEVSQAIPRPMQPLVQLVSWNASAEENGETK